MRKSDDKIRKVSEQAHFEMIKFLEFILMVRLVFFIKLRIIPIEV